MGLTDKKGQKRGLSLFVCLFYRVKATSCPTKQTLDQLGVTGLCLCAATHLASIQQVTESISFYQTYNYTLAGQHIQ